MCKILVLCSTYNGEKYVLEQVESVLSQVGVDVDLLIRDDGSQDGTMQLLKKLKLKHQNIRIIEGENVGCSCSFMELLSEAHEKFNDYDFYAFCDQDDVWLPQKLSEAVEKLKSRDSGKPGLYLGSYQMVDSNLTPISTPKRHPTLDMISAMVSNPATGCTMVFNKKLLEDVAVKTPSYIIMHDYWVYLVCLAECGFVYYDNVPYILYRQHEHNVIGGKKDSFFKKWITRIIKVFKKGENFKSRMAMQLLECYGEKMNATDKLFLTKLASCKLWSSKMFLLTNSNFRGKDVDKNLQLWGLVLTGKM